MDNTRQIQKIAIAFSGKVLEKIGLHKLRIVLKLNDIQQRDPLNKNYCHSHDFCDANKLMFEAMNENDVNSWTLESYEIFESAWKSAKQNSFFIDSLALVSPVYIQVKISEHLKSIISLLTQSSNHDFDLLADYEREDLIQDLQKIMKILNVTPEELSNQEV